MASRTTSGKANTGRGTQHGRPRTGGKGARILVTDATHKNSLAVLRTLGPRQDIDTLDITSPSSPLRSLCNFSIYRNRTIPLSTPLDDLEGYAQELLGLLEEGEYDYFLPVGLNSYLSSSFIKRKILAHTRAAIPDWERMEIAYNKERTMKFAREHGIHIPHTTELHDDGDVDKVSSFPVVLKASDSSGGIHYCKNRKELTRGYGKLAPVSKTTIIAQEYIEGFGCGFYGVYDHGRLVDFFLHKRIKEFPVTGGPSAVARSYEDERLFDDGKRLADALHWHGPIMVEFKYDVKRARYALMEVNPKLWGSLDLTIASGINIPLLLLAVARGQNLRYRDTYEARHYRDTLYRWIFPDEFKSMMSAPSWRAYRQFIRLGGCKHNMDMSDPLPTLYQVAVGKMEGLVVAVNEKKRYPHGRPPS